MNVRTGLGEVAKGLLQAPLIGVKHKPSVALRRDVDPTTILSSNTMFNRGVNGSVEARDGG